MSDDSDAQESCLPSSRATNYDVLDLVGGSGLWQKRIFLIVLFMYMPIAFHNYSMSFTAPNIDHWCARSDEAANWSIEEWRMKAMPPDDKHCSRYENIDLNNSTVIVEQNTIIPCDSWEYNDTFYRSTLVNEWNLVCDKQWLVSLSKSIFAIGLLCSNPIIGFLSDKFGRKPVIFATVFSTVISSTVCAFSTTFTMYLVFRFFIAIGLAGLYNAPYVLLTEVISSEHRAPYCIFVNIGWSSGHVLLPVIAWFIRDWFWVQIALSIPNILAACIVYWLPESPRWLMSKGRVEEAQNILIKAARINGEKHSFEDKELLKEIMAERTEVHESGGSKGSIFTLLKSPEAWKVPVNQYFAWFVTALVYYGLSFNTNELAGDPYINFALIGVVEFPAYFAAVFVVNRCGRRNPLAGSMIISGAACITTFFPSSRPMVVVCVCFDDRKIFHRNCFRNHIYVVV